MGVYRLTRKDISSQNIGITYRTYHGITFLWLATSHGTSLHHTYQCITLLWFAASHGNFLPWIVIPPVRIYVTSLNTLLWDGYKRVLGSVPAQVCIWGVLRDYLNMRSEFMQGSPLQWFDKVFNQHFPFWSIIDLQVPLHYYILNQEVYDAYLFCTIATW